MGDDRCREVLEAHWNRREQFTRPNPRKYPHQALWDSCFTAIAWSGFGDKRAVKELETLFKLQLPSGFVADMYFHEHPWRAYFFWRHKGRADITQPPMYGHALRVMAGRGFDVDHLLEPATRGLNYLFEQRMDPKSGLIRIVHPWESGCDDSQRWDSWHSGRGEFSRGRWNMQKFWMARTLRLRDHAAVGNDGFDVASVGFNAMVAFNARELAALTGDAELLRRADKLIDAIDATWSPTARTWVDVAADGRPRPSSSARTLDALLPVLVSKNPAHVDAAFAEIMNPKAFWRPFGIAGTAADEPTYSPDTYWRGSSWPQVSYLIWVAAERRGRPEAPRIARALAQGIARSGYAEHWNPDSGKGLGAVPLAWAAIAHEIEAA